MMTQRHKSRFRESTIQPIIEGETVIVGNPNRLVKYAWKHQERDYIFNSKTGEIKHPGFTHGDWYFITPDTYPVYKDGEYIGAIWLEEFFEPTNPFW